MQTIIPPSGRRRKRAFNPVIETGTPSFGKVRSALCHRLFFDLAANLLGEEGSSLILMSKLSFPIRQRQCSSITPVAYFFPSRAFQNI